MTGTRSVDPQGRAATTSTGLLVRGAGGERRAGKMRIQQVVRAFSPFALLFMWELAARIGLLDVRFFPAPTMILSAASDMIWDGTIVEASAISLRRLLIGFAIGAGVGIAAGLWLGLSDWSRAIFEPWLQVTYPVPKLAVYPLIVLVVGLGEMPIIILLAIAVFYIVVINTIAGVLSISQSIIDVGRDCSASFAQFVTTIAFPAALPHIFTGLEIALGIGYIVLVASEFVGANSGLGAIIWSSWQVFDVSPMYIAITVVSVLGYVSVLLVRGLGRLTMPWLRAGRR